MDVSTDNTLDYHTTSLVPPPGELFVPQPLFVGHADQALYESGEESRPHDDVRSAALVVAGAVVRPPHVVPSVVGYVRLHEELAEVPAKEAVRSRTPLPEALGAV